MWLAGLILIIGGTALVYFVYDGYGRVLALLAGGSRDDPDRAATFSGPWPTVSVVIPVFNEERRVRRKLDDIFRQEYPEDRMEVIVVSDGSTDATDRIVEEFGARVRLIRTAGRLGKSLAQNEAVATATGDVLVLTDAAVQMAPRCLQGLVAPFANADVGCVSARLMFATEGSFTGQDQGVYWRYELKLRSLESKLGCLATAAGPAMAIRRRLWRDLPAEYGDDCVLPLDVVLQNRRVVQADDAVAWDESFSTARKEFSARVRMMVRNWLGTLSRGELLNPARHPWYAFALWSHKLLRWLSPWFLLAIVVGSALVSSAIGAIWPVATTLLLVLLGLAGMVGLFRGQRWGPLAPAGSFLLVNAAFMWGLLKVIKGQTIKIYETS